MPDLFRVKKQGDLGLMLDLMKVAYLIWGTAGLFGAIPQDRPF